MALRFPCVATSRRRRAVGASLASPSTRVRRASASLRRTSGLWRLAEVERDGAATLVVDARVMQRMPAAEPSPTLVSRR